MSEKKEDKKELDLIYSVEESPPWYLALLLGTQHYLTMLVSTLSVPFVLSGALCVGDKPLALSKLISSILVCSGLITLAQTSLGVRLPIVQGGTFSYLAPAIAILNTFPPCDNETDWKERIVEVQGAIIVSSCFQVALGLFGGVGLLLRFIGPLTVAPAVSLIGLALFDAASYRGSSHWGITIFGCFVITLCSHVLSSVPFPNKRFSIFKLFPVIFGILSSWILCVILTKTNVLCEDPSKASYRARTDSTWDILEKSDWFYFPYPCQWGRPKVTVAGVFGMLAGVLAGLIESIGDYYACARLAGAPPPTKSAMNRGIFIEGLGCVFSGFIGTGNGTTSYSSNIGVIGLTRVGSRRVVQYCAVITVFFGCFAKFGAFFSTIPDPVIGALFYCLFGMVAAVGLSNLQYVNLNNTRNLYILGFALFAGISLPQWMKAHPGYINTGLDELNQILEVLLSTSMFIGGMMGCVLDNLLPGSPEDRGIHKWREMGSAQDEDNDCSESKATNKTYDIPYITKYMTRIPLLAMIPICPSFDSSRKYANIYTNRKQNEDSVKDNDYSVKVSEL